MTLPQRIIDEARDTLRMLDMYCSCPTCEDVVAAALLAAEQRGRDEERERCAKIAEGKSSEFDFAKALEECRDCEHGFHSGRLHAATAIRTEKDKG